jgi:hypothetical protein
MLKFFRKIRQKLIQKNKMGKYLKYAIGEIILVVIGILIALQINNWNEERKNNKIETNFISRLLEDIEEEEVFIQTYVDYNQQVKSYANKALTYFDTPIDSIKNVNQSLIVLYQASQISDARPSRSTYTELLSSGFINIIKSETLRRNIISYYELDWSNSIVFQTQNKYREHLRSYMPSAIQNQIRNNCGDIYTETKRSLSVTLPSNCDIDIDDKLARKSLKQLLSNKQLKENLTFLIGNLEPKLGLMERVQGTLEEVKIQLTSYHND